MGCYLRVRGLARVGGVLALLLAGLPMAVQAQYAACGVNETASNVDLVAAPWASGSSTYSATPHPGFQVTGTAASAYYNSAAPSTVTDGAGQTMVALRTDFAAINADNNASITFQFARPVSNLAIRVSDLDSFIATGGANSYYDRATVTGKAADGSTVLPITANKGANVMVSGNSAWGSTGTYGTPGGRYQCSETSQEWAQCRVDFRFPDAVTEFTLVYDNNPAALGNPPPQQIRMRLLGFCAANAADLEITKTTQTTPVIAGQPVTYQLVARNKGPDPVTGAVVQDTPGAGIACPADTPVNCSGSACPAGPLTMAALTAGVTLGTLAASGPDNEVTFGVTCDVP